VLEKIRTRSLEMMRLEPSLRRRREQRRDFFSRPKSVRVQRPYKCGKGKKVRETLAFPGEGEPSRPRVGKTRSTAQVYLPAWGQNGGRVPQRGVEGFRTQDYPGSCGLELGWFQEGGTRKVFWRREPLLRKKAHERMALGVRGVCGN